MRSTENLSLRLDPEVLRLARRTAGEANLSLREFFEAAIKRHVAALTTPEERRNLLSAVEESFLSRLDNRIKDMLERVAALSAKEALDQAHTLQLVKRVLLAQIRDRSEFKRTADAAWNEAVEKVQKRGRPVPPEVVEQVKAVIDEWEEWAKHRDSEVKELRHAEAAARKEIIHLSNELANAKRELDRKEGQLAWLQGQNDRLQGEVRRETWVADRLDKQGMNPIGRKSAAELREQYNHEHRTGG